jgi:signal transduction histidine kinase
MRLLPVYQFLSKVFRSTGKNSSRVKSTSDSPAGPKFQTYFPSLKLMGIKKDKKSPLNPNPFLVHYLLAAALMSGLSVGIGVYIYNQSLTQALASKKSLVDIQLDSSASRIYTEIALKRQILEDLARIPAVQDLAYFMPNSRDEQDFLAIPYYTRVQSLFTEFLANPGIDFLFLGGINSPIYVSTQWIELSQTYQAQDRNWFRMPQLTGDLHISPPYSPSNAPDTRVITLNMPIWRQGDFVGSIGLDMNMDPILQEMDRINKLLPGTYTLHSFFPLRTTQEYLFLYHPDYPRLEEIVIHQVYRDLGVSESDIQALMEFVLSGIDGDLRFQKGTDQRLLVSRVIPGTTWALMASYSTSQVVAQVRDEFALPVLLLMIIQILVLTTIAAFYRIQTQRYKLQDTLVTLVNTQDELVETSKQLALGRVIMGLAHEINTPLGNALMMGSVLDQEIDIAHQALKKDTNSNPFLISHLTEMGTHVPILQDSLKKMAIMVDRFKQLELMNQRSTKETREIKTIFLEELELARIRSGLKRNQLDVNMIFPPEPMYVGEEFHVIFSELLQNTFDYSLEGCGDSEAPCRFIKIQGSIDQGRWRIAYEDTTPPIPQEIRSQLFDAFITTQRRKGKIGLGLFLVNGIVRNLLSGTIEHQYTSDGRNQFVLTWVG